MFSFVIAWRDGDQPTKIFDYATSQPVVLLLDEFDAIARLRDDQTLNGELRLVVNSLLIQIDKFRG